MYISKKNRELVNNRFGGKCAYTGTDLLPDWQVDHVNPVVRNWWDNTSLSPENHNIDNLLPAQRVVNHYKHSMDLEQFREFMKDFHLRIAKLPKNPKVQKSIRRKAYMLEIAGLFGITPDKAFSGKFYFELLRD